MVQAANTMATLLTECSTMKIRVKMKTTREASAPMVFIRARKYEGIKIKRLKPLGMKNNLSLLTNE